MKSFFEKKDRWGHGMALWVLLAMIFVTPLALTSLSKIDLENDVENWLPADDPQAKVFDWYQDHFDIEERILISWDGSSLADSRMDRLASILEGTIDEQGISRGGSKYVSSVITPKHALERMVKHDVEPAEAVRRLEGVLIGTGLLKVRLTELGEEYEEEVKTQLVEQARKQLGLNVVIVEPTFTPEPDEEYSEELEPEEDSILTAETLAELTNLGEHSFQIRWRGINPNSNTAEQMQQIALGLNYQRANSPRDGKPYIQECFFSTGGPIAVSISLSEAGAADTTLAIEEIRQATEQAGISADILHLGGSPIVGSALNQEVKKSAWNRSYPLSQFHKRSGLLLSFIVGIVLTFIMLRSIRLGVLSIVIAIYTTMVTVSLVPVTGGSMNMVLVVMPTLLMVLTLSGAIHVANYWKHAAYKDLSTAIVESAKMAKQPVILASLTTALGLASLSTSPLGPVRDFGIYAAVGCLIALVMILFGLPALLQFWPAKQPKESDVNNLGWKKWGELISDYRNFTSFACVVAVIAAGYGLTWFRTETKVIRYFPEHSDVVQDYYFLEDNLAGIVPVETVVRFDEESQQELTFTERLELVRQVEEEISKHPEISGTLSLADFQPKTTPPPEDASFITIARYRKKSQRMEQLVKGKNSADVHSFLTQATEPADLNKPGDEKLAQAGDELWRITAQVAIMSDLNYGDLIGDINTSVQSVLKYHVGTGHVVTGMIPLFLRTQQAVLESLIFSFGLAFILIACVMMSVLKSPWAGLITMMPNLMPVILIFGLISWNGIAVDIGTMITASVALGIAVDGTLHLLTWFRRGLDEGMTRKKAISEALGHCGPAMFQTSAAVSIGLLMLFPADLLLVSRFGWLMASLIAAALVADVVFLPALLAGPLGIIIQGKKSESTDEQIENEPAAEISETIPSPHVIKLQSSPGKKLRVDRKN